MNLWYQPLPELQWEQDGFIAQLDPHPLSPSRALVMIDIDDLDEWVDSPPAEALHELLRINGDLLLGTGWAVVLDDDDRLLLRADIALEMLDGPDDLTPSVNLGLVLAASVRPIWAAFRERGTQPLPTP